MTPEQEQVLKWTYPGRTRPVPEGVFPELTPNTRVWVEALRSGDYEQTMGRLVRVSPDRKAFCCLGVGQMLVPGCTLDLHAQALLAPSGEHRGVTPGREFAEWLGLEPKEGWPAFPWRTYAMRLDRVGLGLDGCALATLNDSYRKTFRQIADLIEIHGVRVWPS